MPAPRGPVSVDTLRYAAARALEYRSLRSVADEIGMAPSWLEGFVAGEKRAVPRAKTLRKLREWYIRTAAELREIDETSTAAAVALLLGGLMTDAERRRGHAELVDLLARLYDDGGEPPKWIAALRDPPDAPTGG